MISKVIARFALLAAALMVLVVTGFAQNFSGAIYTTVDNGLGVNVNLFNSKEDVYLNGGPQNMTSNGLPDGTYYFQVTTPNGVLLSTDSVADRRLKVVSGRVAGNGGVGTHPNGSLVPGNGAIPVKLAPFDDSPNGEYKVWLSPNPDFPNNQSKTDNFRVEGNSGGGTGGGGGQSLVTVNKFYDTDGDGIQTGGEPFIEGWLVHIRYTTPEGEVIWEGNAVTPVAIDVPSNARFSVYEYMSSGDPGVYWVPTTPVFYEDQAVSSVQAYTFGNRAFGLGAGGGLTLGFWSNKNGQALIGNDDLAMLRALNLRNANGTNFDPTTNASVKSWLLNGTATNMCYMLSVQLAAMELNVFNGKVNGNALIYAPGASSANVFGITTVNALMNEANTFLGTHGVVLSGDPDRDYAELLKDALDDGNNNLNFVIWLPPIPTFGTMWYMIPPGP